MARLWHCVLCVLISFLATLRLLGIVVRAVDNRCILLIGHHHNDGFVNCNGRQRQRQRQRQRWTWRRAMFRLWRQ